MDKKYVDLAREEMKKEVALQIKNIPSEVKRMINGALLSILGLEHRYSDKYEIDHCNGRNSILIDTIRNMAQKEAESLVKKTNYKPSDLALFQNAFKKEYESHLNYELKKLAENLAREEANNIMKKLSKDIIGEVA